MRDLHQQYFGTEAAMFIADRDGRILSRSAIGTMAERLDEVSARPGFVFDEMTAGTSGLGTALEEESPVVVDGAEHFLSMLDTLSSAGAPIRHPITGRIEGAIDIVCPAGVTSTFTLPLVVRAAGEVEQRLVSGYAAEDRALLDSFLNLDRRGPRRPLIALNGRIFMANMLADELLGASRCQRAMLWGQAQRALADGTSTLTLEGDELSNGVHVLVRRVSGTDGLVGTLVRPPLGPRTGMTPGTADAPSEHAVVHDLVRSLPGTSETWKAVLRRAAQAARNSRRVLLVGPCGVGKSALAEVLLTAKVRTPSTRRLDARDSFTDGPHTWLERARGEMPPTSTLVLSHLEQLPNESLELLVRSLDELPETSPLIVATYRTDDVKPVPPTHLVAQFDHVVEVPGLEDRPEDIPAIVDKILYEPNRLPIQVEPTAMRQLISREWPGNVRQLRRVLLDARNNCGSRTIRAADIPPGTRGSNRRRQLSRLELGERKVISAAIAAADGNMRTAATQLGISRSTLYRKVAALGLHD
ncbi:MAG TPA: helix-turn-helix domain-containing protein [Pseudonocardia sp.]